MARPKSTHARQEQIVAALIRQMARQGYDGASIKEIAQEAGLAPGLLHYHFGSKHEILLAAIDALTQRQSARVAAFLAAASDPRARAEAWIRAMLSAEPAPDGAAVDPHAVPAWIQVALLSQRDEALRALTAGLVERWRAELRALLEDWLRAEDRATGGADAMAAGLIAAMVGSFLLTTTVATPAGFAAPAALAMAEGLVRAQAPAKGSGCA